MELKIKMTSRQGLEKLITQYNKRVMSLISAKKFREAKWVAEEQYRFVISIFGTVHPETAKILNNLGWIKEIEGESSTAECYFLDALKIKKTYFGNYSKKLVPTYENLKKLYITQKKYKSAREILYKLIALAERQNPNLRIRISVYLCELADIEEKICQIAAAEARYFECISFLETNYPTNHPNLGKVLAKLGQFYERCEKFSKAEYFYNRALKVIKRKFNRKKEDLAIVRDGLQRIYRIFNIDAKTP